ncbi:restriction endonuclease subunit R [candidate division NPL-UPA2 bacterium Unc8]|uniref:Restriction endonuclease subunit R n=1 Tax=candidate division NPL-UPA2 bacterium Unc8 TaxID=1980939 RepID=A0A399FZ36_UNCN2|nr:MAG: restriction endonuclease subunit R [candidate division NPL-UPA2 bacterium Unc8]
MNIEKYLVLNKYLLSLFGVSDFRDLQEKLKDARVGVDNSDGRSYFVNVLRSSFEKLRLPEDTLLRYDENIQSYVKKINYKREPVTLKYFQYLAVLSVEIALDNLKNRKFEFLYELNEFLKNYKQEENIKLIDSFTENDLRKLAFWMATGSGKTLITHISYYQFFHYNLFSPDNIILITPNEGLSRQHFEELQKSGIPCRLYTGSLSGLGTITNEREVLVIEMTKFVEEKKGGGVTLSVDVFEGRNLVFVDEGHKGKRSEEQKWARLRNKLAKNGFVFEYSATFGQILSERNKETLEEYAKSILFDYSYKYFYLDGYGKDFSVLNVKQARISEQEFSEIMFVANLLSFYEQTLTFEENKKKALEHNLEKPLWIFVGTTVTGKEEESDVIQIVGFIKRVIQNEDWVKKWVKNILDGNTKLKDEDDKDVFSGKFEYLKKRGIDFGDLYKRVFGGKGSFGIYGLKNAEGELGLKIGENEYFGVINIGDVSGFKKQLEKKGISVAQDAVSDSLFDVIKKESSKISVLIGSKKFIEGWDTWRVSSMGLLNIGRGQGPQIIQLFGRGVRLKGKGMSLKRSEEKTQVQFLEMLNIYGIKADYLSKFLESIRKEEVEFEAIGIPIKPQHEKKWKTLYTLSKNESKKFEEEEIRRLEIDDRIHFTLDLLPKVSIYLSARAQAGLTKERKEEGIKIDQIRAEVEGLRITEDIVDLLDWERIWQEIYDFKIVKGYWNLVLDRAVLKNLLLSDRYKIMALPETLEVKSEDDVRRVEDIALLVIKKYLDLFYRKYAKRFETENLYYDTVGKQLPLFVFEKPEGGYSYTVQIDKRKKELIKEINILARDLNKLLKEDTKTLPRFYFDKHLYVPVLLQSKEIDKISPAGLVDSEKEFVTGLRDYLKKNTDKFSGVEVYLLRNYPRSGVGFFSLSGFYPDFIMWIKNGKKQNMIFIDPKGLEHTKGLDDEKIKLKDDIKQLEQKLGKDNVALESFILSKTPYEKLIERGTEPLSKDKYIEEHHILFLDDEDWPERLFSER